ncbi:MULTISPECIES: hypothetical protein [Bradyrhizobium]|jgi:hypothetical protein|uniref:hypothetical protein n=1 Tax=Bradyrhizobium TaxID=374 RepID=UPI0004168F60|nr:MULTISPECIES: hypothetical protein [Bradyrhizobium]AUC98518.1 hypothetical protein CWS35_32940 [Bradyrhizobium sp. SK17]KIU43909.1 hypothetical protein QU41_29940 [Bradyrhizobium elkanii]OCX27616.1 hypothetical protein QU42_26945 [Bradyrhizobium sp. UASWS1016]
MKPNSQMMVSILQGAPVAVWSWPDTETRRDHGWSRGGLIMTAMLFVIILALMIAVVGDECRELDLGE